MVSRKPNLLALSEFRLIAVIMIIVLIITTVFRVMAVSNYNFAVTHDQARDFLEVASIVIGHRPALVGPTTSINGVFLGPFLYYFLIIPFILGAGDPQWMVFWQIFWYQLAGVALFGILKKRPWLALMTSSLFLLMPVGFLVNRYYWSANLMPAVIAWWLIALLITLSKPTNVRLLVLGLITGIPLQAEAALGILIFPFTWLYLRSKRYKFNQLGLLTIGFGLTLMPQFLYELRHHFSQTQVLIREFTGQAPILGQRLTFGQRLVNRWQILLQLIRNTNHVYWWVVFGLFLASLAFLLERYRKLSNLSLSLTRISLGLLLLSGMFYLLFPQALKTWYLHGLTIPLMIVTAVAAAEIAAFRQVGVKIIPLFLLGLTLVFTIKEQAKYIRVAQEFKNQDPGNLYNEMQVVDWVYKQAQGRGFRVYDYRPEIYDYPNQYVFWWYGTEKYGYQPETITYADNVPAYVKSADKLWNQTTPPQPDTSTPQLVFLILDPDPKHPRRQQAWLDKFNHLCTATEHQFDWKTRVDFRHLCP